MSLPKKRGAIRLDYKIGFVMVLASSPFDEGVAAGFSK
jgi:hypothetical protein